MASPPPRADVRPPAAIRLPAALVAAAGLLLLGALVLLTPAFTDFEAEADPAIQALLAGDVAQGLRLLPLYGGGVLAAFPGAWLVHLLGGGDLAVYRAVAVPGAVGMVVLAVVAAQWQRRADRSSRLALGTAALIGLSPCVALAWNIGHPEEVLVAAAAVGGLIVLARGGARAVVIGGVLLGLAIAAKLSAIVLLPVAVAAMVSRRETVRLLAATTVAGAALLAPVALPKLGTFREGLVQSGADRVSGVGNLWWFFGERNPSYRDPGAADSVQLFTTSNSARLSARFIADHGHELILLLSAVLAALWWWRIARTGAAPAGSRERLASVLLLAAAVLWWRAVADPWFQAYYLTPALLAVVLADARLGRVPVTGLVAWCALWLLHGQNAPDMGLDADATSALRLAWLLPVGVWITIRAMRPVR